MDALSPVSFHNGISFRQNVYRLFNEGIGVAPPTPLPCRLWRHDELLSGRAFTTRIYISARNRPITPLLLLILLLLTLNIFFLLIITLFLLLLFFPLYCSTFTTSSSSSCFSSFSSSSPSYPHHRTSSSGTLCIPPSSSLWMHNALQPQAWITISDTIQMRNVSLGRTNPLIFNAMDNNRYTGTSFTM